MRPMDIQSRDGPQSARCVSTCILCIPLTPLMDASHAGNHMGGGAHGEDASDEEAEHDGRKVYSYMNIRNKVSLIQHPPCFGSRADFV